MILVLGINKARHEILSHTYARFHQRRLTLISTYSLSFSNSSKALHIHFKN